jgi:small subunit ribosomal protein S20
MPVTKSAKRALRVSQRRHEENLQTKAITKGALRAVRKALEAGAEGVGELFNKAQSALDTAAKSKSIHRNKAARLKSRLAKKVAAATTGTTLAKKAPAKKAAAKKAAPRKTTAKKK